MSIRDQLDQELVEYIDLVLDVCSSRAVYVINFILEHGSINSEDIANEGYRHGARAVGDVRDNGIPLITNKTKSSDGKSIAEYVFGPASEIKRNKFGGRINFPASLRKQLLEKNEHVCAISKQELPVEKLEIDHRIPFYISGDIEGERNPDDFMLLSKSMQRSKSWDCENCMNILNHFDIGICKTCYWAYPEDYTHVAMKEIRNLNLTWEGDEIAQFDAMENHCKESDQTIQNYLKEIVKSQFNS
jgi:hypothetical protein